MISVPKINRAYWTALILASIFGANAGDFVADVLYLGHLAGIPWLAAALALVLVAERLLPRRSAVWFWVAIIIVRAAATNIGDIFHDYKIGFSWSVPVMTVLLIAVVGIWRLLRPSASNISVVPIDHYYWVTIFTAGVLGTVAGDAMSYGVRIDGARLDNLYATLILSFPLAIALFVGRNGLLKQLYYYWMTVALIRSAGTSGGDWIAHKIFGLPRATARPGRNCSGGVQRRLLGVKQIALTSRHVRL